MDTITTSEPELRALDWTDMGITTIGGLALVTFEGTYQLEGEQGVIVAVMGPSGSAVDMFRNSARFHFELGPTIDEVPDLPATEPDTLTYRELVDPSNEGLLIEFRLTDAAARAKPKGTLIGTIDPSVPPEKFHNFSVRDPLNDTVSRDTATVTLWVDSGPGVEMRLFWQCLRVGYVDQGPSATPVSLSSTGAGRFDLVIYGLGNADDDPTRYQLRGAWRYNYTTALPSYTKMSLSC